MAVDTFMAELRVAGDAMLAGAEAVAGGSVPYLVGIGNNSEKVDTPQIEGVCTKRSEKKVCPDARWLRGSCEHGTVRFVARACGRRGCEVCGPLGRWRIAERIALGVRKNWPAAWLVLTWGEDVDKKVLVRMVGNFVAQLRRRLPGLQYAATYELTRRGRLHVNLIAGPWKFIPHSELRVMWGARVSVEWVQDDKAIGREGAKSGSVGGLGNYLSKLEQAVPTDRRVSYSKGWPKLPAGGVERKGEIRWEVPSVLHEAQFFVERNGAHWVEARPGEFKSAYGEECDCFERGPT